MLTSRIWHSVTQYCAAFNIWARNDQTSILSQALPDFSFSREWKVLGPFQTGTREATWGADPLEYHGGFRALEYYRNATFKSSLPPNGTISWSTYDAELSYKSDQQADADLSVHFPQVDWSWLKEVYGWAAVQWQGWARGEINVRTEDLVLAFYPENLLEYWIDDVHYFGGDFYGYKKVPVTLRLAPGLHRIDIRLIRDVRSVGGIGKPSIDIKLELQRSKSTLRSPLGYDDNVMIADVIGGDFGPLVSPYAQIIVRNDAENDIYVHGIEGMEDVCELELLSKSGIRLVPGQTRPVAFRVGCVPSVNRRMYMDLKYRVEGESADREFEVTTWPRVLKGMEQPHKVTFVHPGGMVSYAILRPPSASIKCGRRDNLDLPVMIALHGAGLEADDDVVKHALDDLPDLCAWLLFPTGVVPWSGDDWHNWGLADVETAVAAIPRWIEQVDWKGPGVKVDKWLITGHSNGGQGTWYILTHRPDKLIAAAVLSGYSSIQNYVPYSFWHTAEPAREAILQSALLPYRHELLLENAKGIPVLQQHGDDDNNVPVYNARLMSQRIDQAGAESTYFEMPGKGHYWDGVMVTDPLKHFFEQQLNRNWESISSPISHLGSFSLVVADPGDGGPKNGVKILALWEPGRLGKMDVTFDPLTGGCILSETNVWVFRLGEAFDQCDYMLLNGEEVDFSTRTTVAGGYTLRKHHEGWYVTDYSAMSSLEWRLGRQSGAMDALLRTHGSFSIVKHSNGTDHIALQISRNLCQYYKADTDVTGNYDEARSSTGNIVSVAIGDDLPQDFHSSYPINVGLRGISIKTRHSYYAERVDAGRGTAAIFLRPLQDERLELVVWGVDARALRTAARLVPMLTGTGQPDWIVTDDNMLRKGIEGVLAMGFFDALWNVSSSSFIAHR